MFEYIHRFFKNEIEASAFKQFATKDRIPDTVIDFVIEVQALHDVTLPELPTKQDDLPFPESADEDMRALSGFLLTAACETLEMKAKPDALINEKDYADDLLHAAITVSNQIQTKTDQDFRMVISAIVDYLSKHETISVPIELIKLSNIGLQQFHHIKKREIDDHIGLANLYDLCAHHAKDAADINGFIGYLNDTIKVINQIADKNDGTLRLLLKLNAKLISSGYLHSAPIAESELKSCYITFNNLYSQLGTIQDDDIRLFVKLNLAVKRYVDVLFIGSDHAVMEFYQYTRELAESITEKSSEDLSKLASIHFDIASLVFHNPNPQFIEIKKCLRRSVTALHQGQTLGTEQIDLIINILNLYTKICGETSSGFIMDELTRVFDDEFDDVMKMKKHIDRVVQTLCDTTRWQETREIVPVCIQLLQLLLIGGTNNAWKDNSTITLFFANENLLKAYFQQIEQLEKHPVLNLELFLDSSTIPLVAVAKHIAALQEQITALQSEVTDLKSTLAVAKPLLHFGMFAQTSIPQQQTQDKPHPHQSNLMQFELSEYEENEMRNCFYTTDGW